MQNELRKSFDTETWSLISTLEPSSIGCPLCPEAEEKTEETGKIEDATSKTGKWLCRSIVDPYPVTHPMIFKLNETNENATSFKAHGWSEVVIETRDHAREFHELSTDEMNAVLQLYAKRIKDLRGRENVEQIGIVKDNLRTEFDHSYSKIFTLPIVSPKLKEKAQKFNEFQYKKEECMYCNLIKREGVNSPQKGPRFIFENDHFICIAPFSQMLPFECWILPKKHYSCISELGDFEVFTLAETMKNVLRRMEGSIKPLRYTISYYIKPIKEKDFHFHIVIGQKTLHPSIQESYGISFCKLTPEDTARILRGNS